MGGPPAAPGSVGPSSVVHRASGGRAEPTSAESSPGPSRRAAAPSDWQTGHLRALGLPDDGSTRSEQALDSVRLAMAERRRAPPPPGVAEGTGAVAPRDCSPPA
eukprot:7228260-Alexandrium_andersonii.AAC.1